MTMNNTDSQAKKSGLWFRIKNNNAGRLQRTTMKRSSEKGTWLLFLFGSPFFLMGCFIMAVDLGLIPEQDKNIHAPRWVLTMAGGLFAAAGVTIFGMGIRDLHFQKSRTSLARLHPSEPALQDYPWDREGAESPRWKPFMVSLITALGITLFLSIFNWWAFFSGDGPLPVQIIVCLFNLLIVYLWWKTLEALIRGLKFGSSRLVWNGFPQKPEAVRLRWQPGTGLEAWTKASFTLRCVRETHTLVKTAKGSQKQVTHEEIWSQMDELGSRSGDGLSGTVDLHFSAPDDIPGSGLNQESPVFWELEVRVDVPGVDFEHRYLVPVYR